jgi:dihydropteroate synthase
MMRITSAIRSSGRHVAGKEDFHRSGPGVLLPNLQDSAVRVRHQMKVFLNTFRLRSLGWPICHALPHAFEFFREEVRCAEPFFAVLALLGKTDLLRTHEVPRSGR